MRKGLILALALLAMAGCGNILPRKAYEGPDRPQDSLSLLKGGGSGDKEIGPITRVDLRIIDGMRMPDPTYFAAVIPGRHTVGLRSTLRIGMRERPQYCAFPLETLAGCTYIPTAPNPPSYADNPGWEWNVDMVVNVECFAGGSYVTRTTARCGSSLDIVERMAR